MAEHELRNPQRTDAIVAVEFCGARGGTRRLALIPDTALIRPFLVR